MSKQIVILAGGKGSRMGSPIPKVLIPLKGKPIIKHLLNQVEKITQDTAPVIVVGFKSDLVKNSLGKKYIYAFQAEQNGTAHAVLTAKPHITAENIVVLCGDMPFLTSASLQKLTELHEQNGSTISMFTGFVPNFEGVNEHFRSFGRILRNEDGEVVAIKEFADATEEEKEIREVNPGMYIFNTAWLWKHMEEIGKANAQGEFYLTDIIEVAIKDGKHISSFSILPEEMIGINTPDQLSYAHSLVKRNTLPYRIISLFKKDKQAYVK